MYYGYDPYILLVIPAFLFSLYAQFKVRSTFNHYSKVLNRKGITGAEIARYILDRNGLWDVRVERIAGSLTDHYDPRTKVVRLSAPVYSSTSVSAIGVAAHETGHALQHAENYGPLALRTNLVPVAGIGSSMGPYLAIFGLLLGAELLVQIGLILFALAVLFYLITLPVEYNASSRAIRILEESGLLTMEEINPARKVLRAAAMTYLASAAVAVAHLARLVLLTGGRRRD